MFFGNITEKTAFQKGCWAKIEILPDGTVYRGRPATPNATESDECWFIERITQIKNGDDNVGIEIRIAYPMGKSSWENRESLNYLYY